MSWGKVRDLALSRRLGRRSSRGSDERTKGNFMLDKKKKDRIIEKFKTHKNDTGSPEVQIAILSAEIKELTAHLNKHNKDFSSRRGLIRKVAQRRRLLHYLQREDEKRYEKLIKELKIKRRASDTMPEKTPEELLAETETEGVSEAEAPVEIPSEEI